MNAVNNCCIKDPPVFPKRVHIGDDKYLTSSKLYLINIITEINISKSSGRYIENSGILKLIDDFLKGLDTALYLDKDICSKYKADNIIDNRKTIPMEWQINPPLHSKSVSM